METVQILRERGTYAALTAGGSSAPAIVDGQMGYATDRDRLVFRDGSDYYQAIMTTMAGTAESVLFLDSNKHATEDNSNFSYSSVNHRLTINNMQLTTKIIHVGDDNTWGIYYTDADQMNTTIGGVAMVDYTASTVVYNEGGIDVDFRFESADNENLLFLHGSGNNIGMGVADPDAMLEIYKAGTQLKLSYDGSNYATLAVGSGGDLTIAPSGNNLVVDGTNVRMAASKYRRYYHLSITENNPGASGSVWTGPDVNTVGGWQTDAAGEILNAIVDVHADWDGASDMDVEIYFEKNTTGGNPGDTVDLKLSAYYKGAGEAATKSQIPAESVTVVADNARYTQYKATFVLDWNAADNVIQAGDVIHLVLNLETDSSECDNIIINHGSFSYLTTHIGVEDGDE